MNMSQIIISGFGGQGVMFAGKLIALSAMNVGRQVSYLPSYGPEMRGGTANCHVIISEHQIASPVVVNPTTLIVFNIPSLDKFEDMVVPKGIIVYDNSLIHKKVRRSDVKAIAVPAANIANDIGDGKLANMVAIGKMIKETKMLMIDSIIDGLYKIIKDGKIDLLKKNIEALEAGYNYI